MRAIALAKTLGVGSFEEFGSQLAKIAAGRSGFSSSQTQTQAFQHTKASSTSEAGDRPHHQQEPTIPDPFDLEFDRFNGGVMADTEEATATPTPRKPLDPLSRPVDLEFELDRDDPEAVDINQLYESPDEEDEETMGDVDLDDEYDLIHTHVMSMVEPDSSEQEKHLGCGRTFGEAVKEAASGGTPMPPPPPPPPGQGMK